MLTRLAHNRRVAEGGVPAVDEVKPAEDEGTPAPEEAPAAAVEETAAPPIKEETEEDKVSAGLGTACST